MQPDLPGKIIRFGVLHGPANIRRNTVKVAVSSLNMYFNPGAGGQKNLYIRNRAKIFPKYPGRYGLADAIRGSSY